MLNEINLKSKQKKKKERILSFWITLTLVIKVLNQPYFTITTTFT
jgi:hypothetical protein